MLLLFIVGGFTMVVLSIVCFATRDYTSCGNIDGALSLISVGGVIALPSLFLLIFIFACPPEQETLEDFKRRQDIEV